jgi:hypothetical protein
MSSPGGHKNRIAIASNVAENDDDDNDDNGGDGAPSAEPSLMLLYNLQEDDDGMDGGGVSGVIWNRVLILFYGASFGSFRSTPVSVLSLSAGGAGRQRPSSIVRINPTTPLFYFS